MLRPARATDAERLREIERRAGERFRSVGLPEIADDEPIPVERLNAYASAGRSWVVVDDDGGPIGYIVVDDHGETAHIEQVSVDPDAQGQGLGKALIDEAERWARSNGKRALTLTTFRDVPWNGPLYAHLGFRPLAEDELTPQLLAIRESETRHGLDPALRIGMRREVR